MSLLFYEALGPQFTHDRHDSVLRVVLEQVSHDGVAGIGNVPCGHARGQMLVVLGHSHGTMKLSEGADVVELFGELVCSCELPVDAHRVR